MFRLVTIIIRLILEPFNILRVLFCAFGIPYALHRVILRNNLYNGIVCNIKHVILHTIALDKLPHNITRCKAYGIPNTQNENCKM
jgi:hypothetical protein